MFFSHVPRLLLVLLLLSTPAGAQSPESSQPHELSLGMAVFGYASYLPPVRGYGALEASYRRALGPQGPESHILVGGGLRVAGRNARSGSPSIPVPFEVFAQARLRARLGPWEPTLGPELGVSGLARFYNRPIPAEGHYLQEQLQVSPLYLGMSAAPLRFHLGRFTVSALEFHLATSSLPRNSVMRIHIGLVTGSFQL